MLIEEKTIYSKRYPPPEDELEILSADMALPVISDQKTQSAYQNFRRLIDQEPQYEPIPGREEKAQEFIALAKKFSEEHEIDIDIEQTPYSVETSLHLYCTAYPKAMTRQIAQLLSLCDNLFSYLRPSEPSDFTLVLKLDTHKRYLAGKLIDH